MCIQRFSKTNLTNPRQRVPVKVEQLLLLGTHPPPLAPHKAKILTKVGRMPILGLMRAQLVELWHTYLEDAGLNPPLGNYAMSTNSQEALFKSLSKPS